MKKLLSVFLLVSILGAFTLQAQTRKYSNEFLAIGVGADALGMSNATVAITNDVSSGFWNPAGLVNMPSSLQLGLMHSEYFAGIAKYDYGALARKLDDKSAVGLSFVRFGVDDIPNTTELIDAEGNIDYDRITSFSAADYAFIFSYSRKLNIEGLRVGGSAKIVHRKVGDFAKAWGFGLDFGAQYDHKDWKFGIMAKDVTSTFNAWSFSLSESMKETFTLTGNEIPENSLELTLPRLIIGTGKEFTIKEKFTTLIALDMDMTFDGKRNTLIKGDPLSIDPHLGIQLGYGGFIFLRGGAGNFQQETDLDGAKKWTFQPNIGVGVKIKKRFSIDYALTDVGDNSLALYSNVFSLKFNINNKASKASYSE